MERLFQDSNLLYDWQSIAINNIIEHFISRLEYDIKNNKCNDEGLTGYLIIIGELIELMSEQSKWLEYSYRIMEGLKETIQDGKVKTIGAFGGLTDILFAVKLFNAKTGYYNRFLKTVENLTLEIAKDYIKRCQVNISNLRDYHYDLVSGLTGVGMYLLWDEDINNRKEEVLKSILDYFVCLCRDNLYQGSIVPGWHIKYENQTREIDCENFSNGNLNFGMAHGILGPLLVLSEAYKKRIIVEGQTEAIKKILDVYMRFKILGIDGVYNWPSQLRIEDFIDNNCIDRVRQPRASWCYGNTGISRALYLVSKNVGDDELLHFSINNLLHIANLDNKKYLLESPIICHGYAGVLAILNLLYREMGHPVLKNKIHELIAEIIKLYDDNFSYGFMNCGTVDKDGIKVKEYIEFFDMLNGATGVVLALISVMKKKTIWERQLYIV